MTDIEKLIDELYRVRSNLRIMCAGIDADYYNNSTKAIDNAIQTIRELQAQIPKWHLSKSRGGY